MKYIITCLTFFSTFFSIAQIDTVYTLLVKEYVKDSLGVSSSILNKYDFVNGVYFSKKEIKNFKTDSNPFLHSNFIYKNRYLLSEDGYVFDLNKEKYIASRYGEIIALKGDSIIVELEDYYFFSLKKKKYFAINDTIYGYLDRDLAPDLTKESILFRVKIQIN